MHQVAGAGRQRAQAISARHGARRIGRRLDRMDVVMVGANIVRVFLEHGLERGHDLDRVGAGLAIDAPQAPRMQVHKRFREQRLHVEVVGVLVRHRAHRVRVRLVARGRPRAIRAVALRYRVDERALFRRSAGLKRPRLRDRVVSLFAARRIAGQVVIRPQDQGHSPVRDRHLRIDLRRLLERALRLLVIEAVGEGEALIEVLLRER